MRIGGKVDHGEYGMENSESWMESFYLNILSFCYSVDMEHAQATNNRRVHKGGGVFQQFRGGIPKGKP